MPRLKRFSKKKNNGIALKHILYSSFIIIGILSMFVVYKSYAIYKLQQDYDVIKNKIGTYSMGDVRVAVLVDGKEIDTFPSYETNYKVESIECTNGVTATFDVENWQINIADMSATSTKCTVSFNSKETNEVTPVNYTKTELLALNEEYKNVAYENLKTQLVDDIYPIGSIFMTTDKKKYGEATQVNEKLGGTWVRYATDTTLVGYKDGGNEVNYTDGSKKVELKEENLPNHTHKTPQSSLINGLATRDGAHYHTVLMYYNQSGYGTTIPANALYYNMAVGGFAGASTAIANQHARWIGTTSNNEGHTHTVTGTIPEMTTNECKNCSSSPINIQNPYTVVYIYKRTA